MATKDGAASPAKGADLESVAVDVGDAVPAAGVATPAGWDDKHRAAGFVPYRKHTVYAALLVALVGIILLSVLWDEPDEGGVAAIVIISVVLCLIPCALCRTFWCRPHEVESLKVIIGAKKQMQKNIVENQTVSDMFATVLKEHPTKVAVAFEGAEYTFAQFDEASNRVANWAQSAGLAKRDTISLLMENRPEFIYSWLGMSKVGITSALINYNLKGTPLVHSITESKSKVVIVGSEFKQSIADVFERLPEGTKVFVYKGLHGKVAGPAGADGAGEAKEDGANDAAEGAADGAAAATDERFGDLDAALATASAAAIPASARDGIGASDLNFLIYTSGTTGLPKAAKIKHLRFFGAGMLFSQVHHVVTSDRIYCPLPLYHSAAGMVGVSMSWYTGATLVLRRKFSASKFWQDCTESQATVIQYIGELCRYLLTAPAGEYDRKHNVQKALGNGMRPEVWEKFQAKFNIPYIGEFYGATEGNATLVNNRNRVSAVGYVAPLLSKVYPVKIVRFDIVSEEPIRNSKGLCVECKPGEIGELIGKIVADDPTRHFDGYTNPKATQKKILRDAFAKGDAWFRSGDLLVKDAEGFFFFKDRIGDTFRWKGENVATSEVAEVCSQYAPCGEINIYGVEIPGKDGRAGMGAIVVNPEEGEFDFAAFYKIVAADLPPYAQPLFLRMQPEMEITGTFKNRKVEYVREGYKNVTEEGVQLLFRDDNKKTYVPLTDELVADIEAGKVRV